jgi:hypothetical protein
MIFLFGDFLVKASFIDEIGAEGCSLLEEEVTKPDKTRRAKT